MSEAGFTPKEIARDYFEDHLNMHRKLLIPPCHRGCVLAQRLVHVLAMRQYRTLLASPELMGGIHYRSSEVALREYCEEAINLTHYISNAAKAGKLPLRHRKNGVILTRWQVPDESTFWGIFGPAMMNPDPRKCGDLVLYFTRLPMHFDEDVAVNLEQFEEWAVAEKLVEPGEISDLLSEDTPENVRLLLKGDPVRPQDGQGDNENTDFASTEEKSVKPRTNPIKSAIID